MNANGVLKGETMSKVEITIGDHRFDARFRYDLAPETCACFTSMLPWRQEIIHARWSGEACWIPLGSLDLNVGYESATSHPQPGDILFYPGGISEAEILLAYGGVSFASKAGQLAGNPFLAITGNLEKLARVGREILWSGSRSIQFTARC